MNYGSSKFFENASNTETKPRKNQLFKRELDL